MSVDMYDPEARGVNWGVIFGLICLCLMVVFTLAVIYVAFSGSNAFDFIQPARVQERGQQTQPVLAEYEKDIVSVAGCTLVDKEYYVSVPPMQVRATPGTTTATFVIVANWKVVDGLAGPAVIDVSGAGNFGYRLRVSCGDSRSLWQVQNALLKRTGQHLLQFLD